MRALFTTLCCVGAVVLGASGAAAAPLTLQVVVNTAPLINSADGPFSLYFQLTDGSGLSNSNNTATISDFAFTGPGAGPSGSPTLAGGATGSLSSAVTLTDSSFLNEFFQSFVAGSSLSFRVLLTNNVDQAPTPDAFSFALLDKNLLNIATNGLGNSLLLVDISRANLSLADVQTFQSTSPPGVTVAAAAVPEPGSVLLLGAAMLAMGMRRLRR